MKTGMGANPIELLTAYRRQVLGLILPRADDSLHVREISRPIGVSAHEYPAKVSCLAAFRLFS
mgnify:FL=1